MEVHQHSPHCLSVHPVYGAIYKDGEFVQRGAVLGLAVDSKGVVVAPVSGWVRMGEDSDMEVTLGLSIEIWPQLPEAHAV